MDLQRVGILLRKEQRQLFRDPFSFLVGILLPFLMLILLGYAMSTDVRNIRLAIVAPEKSAAANELIACFQASHYFQTEVFHATQDGNNAIKNHQVDACLYLPQDFPRQMEAQNLSFLVTLNATNASQAMLKESYILGILSDFLGEASPTIQVESRMWFNDANDSRYYMIPGVIVIIMSLIGTILTAMLMAREYEHGNLESMFVTPMSSVEILVAKAVNNFFLGLLGLAMTLSIARYLFDVPIRGSVTILVIGSSIFLLFSLAFGLLLSSMTKNQFFASQLALVLTFIPTFTLSGFLFEIQNMPLFLQYLSVLVPGRYYVDFLQTIFLVGNVWPNILKNLGILTGITIFLMLLAKQYNPKTLEG